MVCEKCGNIIGTSEKFCPRCGNPVQNVAQPVVNQKKKTWIPVVVVAIVIIVGLAAFFIIRALKKDNNSEESIDEFMKRYVNAMNAKDYNEIIDCMIPKVMQGGDEASLADSLDFEIMDDNLTYEINGKREISSSEIGQINDLLKESVDGFDGFSKGYIVNASFYGNTKTETMESKLLMYDGKYYDVSTIMHNVENARKNKAMNVLGEMTNAFRIAGDYYAEEGTLTYTGQNIQITSPSQNSGISSGLLNEVVSVVGDNLSISYDGKDVTIKVKIRNKSVTVTAYDSEGNVWFEY